MTALERHLSYVPVQNRWLEELPAGWDVVRARYLCRIGTGTGDTIDAVPDGQYPFIVRSQRPLASNDYGFDCEAVLTSGDGAGVGEIFHHVQGRFLAHQRVYVLRDFRRVEPRFFYYYFSAFFGQMALDGSSKSTVDSVRRWMVADMPIALPPMEVQRIVARYLDAELGRLDHMVQLQEGLVERIREREQALRSAHLLVADRRAKTSVRRVLKKLNRPSSGNGAVVTAYRDGRVTLRSNRREDGYTLSTEQAGYQGVVAGDLVFHALDGFAGAVGISDSDGVASPVYHVCQTHDGHDPQYVALLLRQLAASGFLTAHGNSVRQRSVDFRNWATFARVPLWMPDKAEQRRVVDVLTRSAGQSQALIEKTTQFIALSKERRAALITAAVTGQIDVRKAA